MLALAKFGRVLVKTVQISALELKDTLGRSVIIFFFETALNVFSL